MSITEKAINQMEERAADDSHGYDQTNRWGPDYDCSSAVIEAWELAGVPVKTNGATYTGNMRGVFLRYGFEDVTGSIDLSTGAGLQRGDVLLNIQHHTAMYCGSGMEVEASINENGGVSGGQTGDQTGREFLVRPYRNYPWDCVLRYTGTDAGTSPRPAPTYFYHLKLPLLKPGMESAYVVPLCYLLMAYGYDPGTPGTTYTEAVAAAVTAFQTDRGLLADGEAGGQTWGELLKG